MRLSELQNHPFSADTIEPAGPDIADRYAETPIDIGAQQIDAALSLSPRFGQAPLLQLFENDSSTWGALLDDPSGSGSVRAPLLTKEIEHEEVIDAQGAPLPLLLGNKLGELEACLGTR